MTDKEPKDKPVMKNVYVIREKEGFSFTTDSEIFDDDRMWRGFVLVIPSKDYRKLVEWMEAPMTDKATKRPWHVGYQAYLHQLLKEVRDALSAMTAWDEAEQNARPYSEDNGRAYYQRLGMCRDAFKLMKLALTKLNKHLEGE